MRPTLTIEDIYATPASARMLRVLAYRRAPMSTRWLARAAKMSHPAAGELLRKLQAMGLVSFGVIGRAHVWELIRSNIYVRDMVLPAVDAEHSVIDELRIDLTAAFAEDSISLILFGSYAYGEQQPLSDIDVFVLVEDAIHKQRIEERESAGGVELLEKYGSPLSLMVYTREEAAEVFGGESTFRYELGVSGIILHGLGVKEWGIDGGEAGDAERIKARSA